MFYHVFCLQGDRGAEGLPGIPGQPGEDGILGQKVKTLTCRCFSQSEVINQLIKQPFFCQRKKLTKVAKTLLKVFCKIRGKPTRPSE